MKENWSSNKLGQLCEIYNGNSINAEYKKKHFLGALDGYPFIATKDVSPLGTIDYNNGVRIPNYNDYKIARPNSVFICAEGGSAGKKFAFVEQNVCFGNKLFCITPKNEILKGKFIYYFIQSQRFKEQFNSLLSGLIGGVSAGKFKEIIIDFPSKNEQQRIVERLDAAFAQIDELKKNAERQLAEARALFQSALTQAMQPKPGWQEKKMGQICKIERGGSPRPIKQFITDSPDGVNWIKIGDTDPQGKYIFSTKERIKPEGIRRSRWVEENDFLLSNSMSFGRPYILKTSGCIHDGWLVLRDYQESLDIDYFYYLLTSSIVQKQFKTKAQGSTVSNLNTDRVADVTVCYPSIDQQKTIASQLDALSSHVRELEEISRKTAAECDALKQALLRQIFE